jgi:hypothetical protein
MLRFVIVMIVLVAVCSLAMSWVCYDHEWFEYQVFGCDCPRQTMPDGSTSQMCFGHPNYPKLLAWWHRGQDPRSPAYTPPHAPR